MTLTPDQESRAVALIAASDEANARGFTGNAPADHARTALEALMLVEELVRPQLQE